eukprot:6573255-Pyramimonas_sp.AAC.1
MAHHGIPAHTQDASGRPPRHGGGMTRRPVVNFRDRRTLSFLLGVGGIASATRRLPVLMPVVARWVPRYSGAARGPPRARALRKVLLPAWR